MAMELTVATEAQAEVQAMNENEEEMHKEVTIGRLCITAS